MSTARTESARHPGSKFLSAILGRTPGQWSPLPSIAAAVAVGIGAIVAIVLYVQQFALWEAIAVAGAALIVGMAALMVGGLAGFLFGIPRAVTSTEGTRSSGLRANTNLEQISDWLTKILVGVGLTQVREIPTLLRGLAGYIAPALGNETSSGAFGLALSIYLAVSGFLIGFVSTRILFTIILELADRALDTPPESSRNSLITPATESEGFTA